MAHPDTRYVLAAAYGDGPAAVEDYQAVKALYYAVQTARGVRGQPGGAGPGHGQAARRMTAREPGMASGRLAEDMRQADESVTSGREPGRPPAESEMR